MSSISFGIALALSLLATPEVQLGDPFSMFPPVAAPDRGPQDKELFAARGEAESIALWLRNDDEPRQLVACDIIWRQDDVLLPLQVFQVAPEGSQAGTLAPLLPFSPMPLAPGALCHLFLRLTVPDDTPPGRHPARITLHYEGEETQTVPMIIEVFDFNLPGVASLPVLLGLDRAMLKRAATKDETLESWTKLYNLLANARMGFQVWPGQAPDNQILYDYSNVDLVKEHLDHVTRLPGIPVIGIGGQAGELLRNWPAPVLDSPQDPLQFLLFSIMAHLEASGWRRPAILISERLPKRPEWQQIRATYARVARCDARVTRLLAAPVHPFFERYTDIWALPQDTNPEFLAALRAGESLVRYPPLPYSEITSSETTLDNAGTYQTSAEDAFDGSPATAWRANLAAGDAWLAVTLTDLTPLETITILWPDAEPGPLPQVETAYQPESFSRATVDWETEFFATESGQAASIGTIKYPRPGSGIRLVFAAESLRGTVSVAEILVNRAVRDTVTHGIKPVQPWLDVRTPEAALALPETAAMAFRAIPWFCWQQGFNGVLGPVLGANGPDGAESLLTTGPDGPIPTSALLHLADGLEDYEYLMRYQDALRRGDVEPPADFRPGFLLPPRASAQGANAARALEVIRDQRKTIGRLLSGQRAVTRNFGPRT